MSPIYYFCSCKQVTVSVTYAESEASLGHAQPKGRACKTSTGLGRLVAWAEKAIENYIQALKTIGNWPVYSWACFRSETWWFLPRSFRGSMALLALPFPTSRRPPETWQSILLCFKPSTLLCFVMTAQATQYTSFHEAPSTGLSGCCYWISCIFATIGIFFQRLLLPNIKVYQISMFLKLLTSNMYI